MKLSWGTGILLAILAFVGFIMYFFVITLVDKQYDHEWLLRTIMLRN